VDNIDFHRGITLTAILPEVPKVVTSRSHISFDASVDCFVQDESVTTEYSALPPDWFLRVAQTDPADIDELTALVDAYGSFGVDRVANLDGFTMDASRLRRGVSFKSFLGRALVGELESARARAKRAHSLHGTFATESRESITAGARVLEEMLSLWEQLAEAQPKPRSRRETSALLKRSSVGFRLAEMLDEGLSVLAPRAWFSFSSQGAVGSADAYRPPLLHLLVLQMAREIQNDWNGIRVCGNDRCGKLFARQLGRATTRAPRKDSRFCSSICARQYHQREYRARKRAAAKAERGSRPRSE
jgi:hypothetical protein